MIRYQEVEKIVYQQLESNCFGNKKRQGYRHLFGVSHLCLIYSNNLDKELCAIIGLLHDYSIYRNNSSFNHGPISSELAKQILIDTNLFSDEEIEIVRKAIYYHSNKGERHDEYCELLKMCDVLDKYLYEPDSILNNDLKYYLELTKSSH